MAFRIHRDVRWCLVAELSYRSGLAGVTSDADVRWLVDDDDRRAGAGAGGILSSPFFEAYSKTDVLIILVVVEKLSTSQQRGINDNHQNLSACVRRDE
jgi:hypothetical protein